jgi:hypothetical protein
MAAPASPTITTEKTDPSVKPNRVAATISISATAKAQRRMPPRNERSCRVQNTIPVSRPKPSSVSRAALPMAPGA